MNTNTNNQQMSNNQQIQQFQNLIKQTYDYDTIGVTQFHKQKNLNKMGWLISYCRNQYQDIKNFWYNKKEKRIYGIFYGDTCADKHFNKKSYGCYVFKHENYNHDAYGSIPYMIIDTGYFGVDWTKGYHKGTRYCILTCLIEYYQKEQSNIETEQSDIEVVQSDTQTESNDHNMGYPVEEGVIAHKEVEEEDEEEVEEEDEEEVEEDDGEEVEEDDEEEVEEVEIDGKTYFCSETTIYECTDLGDVGDECGYFKDGEAIFTNDENESYV